MNTVMAGGKRSLEQWTDRALRQCLELFSRSDVVNITYKDQCVMRGQLHDLLKQRRARVIRNRKLGLVND
jgi:DNA mismatch repair ATPase MutS